MLEKNIYYCWITKTFASILEPIDAVYCLNYTSLKNVNRLQIDCLFIE